MKTKYLFYSVLILALVAVSGYFFLFNENEFIAGNFNPVTNWDNSKTLYMDYDGAVENGFIIPSIKQTDSGYFKFTFTIKNNSGSPENYFYKIYYQNESYKFPEVKKVDNDSIEHPDAQSNFYGSWEDVSKTFLSTPQIPSDGNEHRIEGRFRIVGNPRDEKRYYGVILPEVPIDEAFIRKKIQEIKNSPSWIAVIKSKAAENNTSVDEQLRKDAIFVIREDNRKDVFNQRWKRNPRVGKYRFMLVLTRGENIQSKKVPDYVQNIGLKNKENFVNPFYYFLYGPGKKLNNTQVLLASQELTVAARPDAGRGIFIRKKGFENEGFDENYYSTYCNDRYEMYKEAHYSQFFHSINKNHTLENIPVTADVDNNYTLESFQKNASAFKENQLVKVPVRISCCPCKTLKTDPASGKITLINPGNKAGENRKENVGVITRHGFTYGKFRAKVKLARLLNDHNIWNGLTNAIWMIYQSDEGWNNRKKSKGGYILKEVPGNREAPRSDTIAYSEIDFEIVKASRYWPATSYPKGTKVPGETAEEKDKIVVTCTNWDMASPDPPAYNVGVHNIKYGNTEFPLHRWDHWYKAITIKQPEPDRELFGTSYYYFEIEWKPEEIIWRIGPEKNKMRIVGYMNNTVTSIPDNQMLMVITQEFHLADWWPESPFSQDHIPFPKNDLKGEVLEIEIE